MRQFGWGRFNPYLQDVSGASEVKVSPNILGNIDKVTLYDRALRTFEALGNYGK